MKQGVPEQIVPDPVKLGGKTGDLEKCLLPTLVSAVCSTLCMCSRLCCVDILLINGLCHSVILICGFYSVMVLTLTLILQVNLAHLLTTVEVSQFWDWREELD